MRHRAGALHNRRGSVVMESMFAGGPGGDLSQFRVENRGEQAALFQSLLIDYFRANRMPPRDIGFLGSSLWWLAVGEAIKTPPEEPDMTVLTAAMVTYMTPVFDFHAGINTQEEADDYRAALIDMLTLDTTTKEDTTDGTVRAQTG